MYDNDYCFIEEIYLSDNNGTIGDVIIYIDWSFIDTFNEYDESVLIPSYFA